MTILEQIKACEAQAAARRAQAAVQARDIVRTGERDAKQAAQDLIDGAKQTAEQALADAAARADKKADELIAAEGAQADRLVQAAAAQCAQAVRFITDEVHKL